MSSETIIKVFLVVLFLLYAYFMIGGYTPCPMQRPYPGYSNPYEHMDSPCTSRPYYHSPTPYSFDPYSMSETPHQESRDYSRNDKTIYQMGPYLDF